MIFPYKKIALYTLICSMPLLIAPWANAAIPVNLAKQKANLTPVLGLNGLEGVTETSRLIDENKTLHIRFYQTYAGYQVFGGDGIAHIPQANPKVSLLTAAKAKNVSYNGRIYQHLAADLGQVPTLKPQQAQLALQQAITNYEHSAGKKVQAQEQTSELIVFVDENNQAHWAYKVSFFVPGSDGVMPAKPVMIVDVNTQTIYAHWDEIQTLNPRQHLVPAASFGGGYGGNIKMGKMTYDGALGNLPKLNILRDDVDQSCVMQNKDVTIKHYRSSKVIKFACPSPSSTHDGVYWNNDYHAVNDGYSPDNDALFGGQVIKGLYKTWYKVDVLTQNGKPMMLNMVVHDPIDNAYWDGKAMTFGDGEDMFYPLTSLGVAAHEISHGFTQQHSNLRYYAQSGGMNEAFSDMAAQAAEFYAYGKNSWQIGPEIIKAKNKALRYMDIPSKDCDGGKPGRYCSIDTVDQYHSGLDVHYSSGIYNRIFYQMGTAEGWDTRKAFDVMVKANMLYWTASSTFADGACGILRAATDLKYPVEPVLNAFKVVGLKTLDCV